ncbi:MAG: hypothetical protein ACW99U_07795 [Candidatus Thorarchaeota archaeon]
MDEEKVRYISFVRKEGGEPILGIPYREMSVDPDLVASFVLAVIIFENRQLKTFTKEGYVVVIEEGKHVVGLLIVDRVEDEDPYREALKQIIERFEAEYEVQLNNWKGDIRPFREFALCVLGIFPYRRLNWDLVPRLVPKSEATPDRHASIPWSVGETDKKVHKMVGFINGKRTFREIVDASGLREDEGLAIVSMLDRYNWITVTRHLSDQSVLVKIIEPPKFLLGVYGDQLVQIVELFDGSRTLSEVCDELPTNIEVVRTVAKNLIDAGVIDYVDSVERGGT